MDASESDSEPQDLRMRVSQATGSTPPLQGLARMVNRVVAPPTTTTAAITGATSPGRQQSVTRNLPATTTLRTLVARRRPPTPYPVVHVSQVATQVSSFNLYVNYKQFYYLKHPYSGMVGLLALSNLLRIVV